MRGYLYLMIVAAAVTYVTTPLVRRIARRVGAITPVRDRDVHAVPIPRLGGVAMFLGFAAAILTASVIATKPHTKFLNQVFDGGHPWGVLLGALVVCVIGVADDIWQLDAVTKAAGQAIAAGLMAWKGVQLVTVPFMGQTILSTGVLVLLTVFVVLLTINAVNFVDGLDGLAAGVIGIAASAFFVYSYILTTSQSPQDYSSVASMVTASLVGCCLGFLPHNFNPARIFMGDSGSMLIGLLMASATIEIAGQVDPGSVQARAIAPTFFPLVLPVAVLALPLVDLALAVVRRTRRGQMFWHPDKKHLHHRMLALGHSHASAVLILYAWTATFAFGVALMAWRLTYALVAGALAVAAATALTLGPLRRPRRRPASRHAQ